MAVNIERIEALRELANRHWSRKSLAELDDGLAEALRIIDEKDEARIKLRLILIKISEELEDFRNGGL